MIKTQKIIVWRIWISIPVPRAYEAGALPFELIAPPVQRSVGNIHINYNTDAFFISTNNGKIASGQTKYRTQLGNPKLSFFKKEEGRKKEKNKPRKLFQQVRKDDCRIRHNCKKRSITQKLLELRSRIYPSLSYNISQISLFPLHPNIASVQLRLDLFL